MAIFVKQDDERTKLQQRLTAELQEKARKNGEFDSSPDGVHDSAYLDGTKPTTSLAFIWIIIAIVGVAVLVWLVVASS
jgi:hypothetical protein